MPVLGSTRASLVPLILAIVAIAAVYFCLRDTHWGLRLKAIGLNPKASERMGIGSTQHLIVALVVCGALAGLAGSIQTTAVYHRLIPSISGGYGYLSQLVVLLSGLSAQVGAPRSAFLCGAGRREPPPRAEDAARFLHWRHPAVFDGAFLYAGSGLFASAGR